MQKYAFWGSNMRFGEIMKKNKADKVEKNKVDKVEKKLTLDMGIIY